MNQRATDGALRQRLLEDREACGVFFRRHNGNHRDALPEARFVVVGKDHRVVDADDGELREVAPGIVHHQNGSGHVLCARRSGPSRLKVRSHRINDGVVRWRPQADWFADSNAAKWIAAHRISSAVPMPSSLKSPRLQTRST